MATVGRLPNLCISNCKPHSEHQPLTHLSTWGLHSHVSKVYHTQLVQNKTIFPSPSLPLHPPEFLISLKGNDIHHYPSLHLSGHPWLLPLPHSVQIQSSLPPINYLINISQVHPFLSISTVTNLVQTTVNLSASLAQKSSCTHSSLHPVNSPNYSQSDFPKT